jgi:hypothetical protein
MKKLIPTILMGFTSLLSADLVDVHSSILDITPAPVKQTLVVSDLKPLTTTFEKEVLIAKPAFIYFRFAAAERDVIRPDTLIPGIGIGYRRLAGNGAADVSVNGIGYASRKEGQVFWTAPKASYYYYLQPRETQSIYLGGGLAWGGLASKEQYFVGIIPSLTAGIEFARKSTVLAFGEINISQAAIALRKGGAFPGPVAECTMGMGF